VCFSYYLAWLLYRSEFGWLTLTGILMQVNECMELVTTIYVTRSVLGTPPTPTPHHHTVYYQIRQTVCPTLSVNCTFKYKHSSADQLPFFRITKLCFRIYIFTHVHHSYLTWLHRHHVNWPTYNKQMQKRASNSANNAQNFATVNASKMEFFR